MHRDRPHRRLARFSRGFVGWALVCMMSACAAASQDEPAAADSGPPNIVYLYADDLGYGEVGAYGQEIIRTPNIDRLAAEGMMFTAHYSGSAVCAPSRASLLTGKHTGHAYIRDNKELGGWGPDEPEGQWPLAAEELTLAEVLKDQGYATAAIGKWGLGGPDDHGHPNDQGFDLFYGYLCQRVAHNYYPTHLWRNRDKDMLPGNEEWFSAHQRIEAPPEDPDGYAPYAAETYAPDRMVEEALEFIRASADGPFFLYFPTVVPHVAIQVPEDSLAEYSGSLDEGPYLGDRGYLPHPEPRAGYAAMITRMDRDIGRILDLLDELGLANNTVVMFSSDNGPTFNGGTDSEFFESAAGMRGLKTELYEGGIKVPMIARWPGRIAAASATDHLSAQWDVMPTVLELVGAAATPTDGISFAPTLLGSVGQARHETMYWELGRQQAVRADGWKLYRRANADGEIDTVQLFHLDEDPDESTDLAAEFPERVQALIDLARTSRTVSEIFPSVFDTN